MRCTLVYMAMHKKGEIHQRIRNKMVNIEYTSIPLGSCGVVCGGQGELPRPCEDDLNFHGINVKQLTDDATFIPWRVPRLGLGWQQTHMVRLESGWPKSELEQELTNNPSATADS